MENLAMCRICMAQDVRMQSIINTNLQETYERLTLTPFETKDNRPLQVCYICYARLRNCYCLQTNCIRSEELFTRMLHSNEIPRLPPDLHEQSIPAINCDILHISFQQIKTLSIRHQIIHFSNLSNDDSKHKYDYHLKDKNNGNIYEENIDEPDVKVNYSMLPDVNDVTINDKLDHLDVIDVHDNIYRKIKIKLEPAEKIDDAEIKVEDIEDINKLNIEDTGVDDSIHSTSQLGEYLKVNKIVLLPIEGHSCNTSGNTPKKTIQPILKEAAQINRKSSELKTEVTLDFNESIKKTIQNMEEILKKKRNGHFVCDLCQKSFSSKYALCSHILRKHTEIKKYKCNKCSKSYINKNELNNHIHTHSGQKPYKCDICGTCFGQQQYLKSHLRIHVDENPYKCNQCEKSFRCKSNLNEHIYLHSDVSPYKCDICLSLFGQKQLLDDHMQIHVNEKPFKCYTCDKLFSKKALLKSHIVIHTGEKPYKCDICKECFRNKRGLTTHSYTHTGGKPYKCDICEKQFILKQHLKSHMHTHTGEKSHKCQICERYFRKKDTLNSHIRTHTGERPYKCDQCDKSFNQKTSLKIHMRTHTGEKPYKCSICDKYYAYRVALVKHMRLHNAAKL